MKKADVKIGSHYTAKVSGRVCGVKIVAPSIFGGWDAINTNTGRTIRIKTAARLRPIFSRQFIVEPKTESEGGK